MGADQISSWGRCLLQQDEHDWSNTSPTRTSQVCQCHVATRVLLTLGANNTTDQNKHSQHAAKNCIACCLCYTGQTGGQRRSGRWQQEALVTPLGTGTKTTSQTQTERKQEPPQNLANQLETCQELIRSTTEQSCTCLAVHPRQIPERLFTSQTGQAWAARDEQWATGQPFQTTFPISRFDSHKTLGY
jgi:hypothetical protein